MKKAAKVGIDKEKVSEKETISAVEFFKMFPNEEAARVFLENKIWEGSPVCPYCVKMEITTLKRVGVYRCRSCRQDFTIRVGSIMGRSKISLVSWLYTMYLMVTARKGISSLQLSKELGITQKSAWFLLHRLRGACAGSDKMLSGVVEADESYFGGKEKNKHSNKRLKSGRGTVGKIAVLGMRERMGNVKAVVVSNTDVKTIQEQVRKTITPGSVLCSDEHAAYTGMDEYTHLSVVHSAKEYVNEMAHTNGIESVWSVLKRGYFGVYHSFSTKHLQRYVDEFSFRLNGGSVKIHTLDRIAALSKNMTGKRITYKKLTA